MHQSRARRWDSTVAPDQLLINRLSAISLGAICHHCLPCPCHHHRSINIILKALSVKISRWQNQPKIIHYCSWINHALLPYFLLPSIVTKYKFDVKILNQSRDFLLATVLISPPTWDLISEIRCRPLLESPWEGSALAARLMSDILEGTWETDGKPRKTQETSKHHFALFPCSLRKRIFFCLIGGGPQFFKGFISSPEIVIIILKEASFKLIFQPI